MYQHATFREFDHYAAGIPSAALARRLRCTSATIAAWRSGRRPPPWWAAELLRLQEMEALDLARQMGYAKALPRLGIVRGEVIDFPSRRPPPAPAQLVSVTPLPEPGMLQA